MDDQDPDHERTTQIRNALLKAGAVIVGIAVVIALGTLLLVKGLGLSEVGAVGPAAADPTPVQPLPTTALPMPGKESGSPSPSTSPSESPSASPTDEGKLLLSASPVMVRPMERVTLTGTYPAHDAISLKVQRFENGRWTDFPVSASVRVGTFDTYLMTGRSGENKFRVFDPIDKVASNPVTVTIG